MDQRGGESSELNQEDALLVRMVVETVHFPQFLLLLNEHLTQAEEAGWFSLVKAIRELLDGERNPAKFDHLDSEDRKILTAVLRGLADYSDVPDVKSEKPLLLSVAAFQKAQSLHQAGNLQEAIALYELLLTQSPKNPEFLACLGTAALQLGKFEASVQLLEQSLQTSPKQPGVLINLGLGLMQLNKVVEALECFDRSIALKPDYAEAYSNRGNILIKLKRFDDALASFDHAIALKPDYVDAHYNRGIVFAELKRFDEVLACNDRVIALKPDHAEAYGNHANALYELKRFDEALTSFDRAIGLKQEIDFIYGRHLLTKMHLSNWHEVNALITRVKKKTENHEKASSPFAVLALIGSAETQKRSAEIFVAAKRPPGLMLPKIQKHPRHKKIRIGYFSADLRNHPMMHLLAELFEIHDRSKFELIAFSFGLDTNDEWRRRAVKSFDQFVDVRSRSDREVALLARSMEIDIAVDLNGFTADNRTGIFAERAAPIQVNYMGYPGTMGAEYIDYIIADRTLIPEDKQSFYAERIAYLPNSYMVNDTKRARSEKTFTRTDVGLPETGFVFCCFNNNYKILPDIFSVWMQLLHQVEGSVLWLYVNNQTARNNLRSEAMKRGVDANRLVFAEHIPVKDHLVRIQSADLFLDTYPCNAHTTASDALRSGLPVLTYPGEAFASRVAASLLNAVGLPELIANSLEAYAALALELATNPSRLAQLKEKLKSNLPTAPLFDTPLFTRHIEAAYVEMHERYQDGLAPEHIYVAP